MKRALRALLILGLIVALGLWARGHLASAIRIAGTSMADTLTGGDVVLVSRLPFAAAFGDVVECRFPARDATYVKRVIGLPGDAIAFSDGTLLRNGTPVSEPYVSSETEDFSIVLGEDEYLVLGDNRAESYDSRAEDMGVIGGEAILGRAQWILWPPGRIGPVE